MSAFSGFHPTDGYATQVVALPEVNPTFFELYVGIRGHGEWQALPEELGGVSSLRIGEWRDVDGPGRGTLPRTKLLLDAVCRYFNTGGDWQELSLLLEQVRPLLVSGLQFEGYSLYDTGMNPKGQYVHVFLSTNGINCVEWTENQGLKFTTLARLYDTRTRKTEKTDTGQIRLLGSQNPPAAKDPR